MNRTEFIRLDMRDHSLCDKSDNNNTRPAALHSYNSINIDFLGGHFAKQIFKIYANIKLAIVTK